MIIEYVQFQQLLDEISAALDSVSEAALHSALERMLQVGLCMCAGGVRVGLENGVIAALLRRWQAGW